MRILAARRYGWFLSFGEPGGTGWCAQEARRGPP